jgi:hypothetical protein
MHPLVDFALTYANIISPFWEIGAVPECNWRRCDLLPFLPLKLRMSSGYKPKLAGVIGLYRTYLESLARS